MNIREFQSDLHHMTLEQALIKHNTNLKTVFHILHYKDTAQGKKGGNTGEMYIRYDEKSKSYMLRKNVNGKYTYFGRYKTLEDAVRVRDYMMTHGWYRHRLKSIRKKLNV